MVLQIFSKYAREMSGPVMVYKYLVSMLERYVRYCHDLQIFSKYAREMPGIVMILQIFSKYAREICQVLS